jgi:hypothetical protein
MSSSVDTSHSSLSFPTGLRSEQRRPARHRRHGSRLPVGVRPRRPALRRTRAAGLAGAVHCWYGASWRIRSPGQNHLLAASALSCILGAVSALTAVLAAPRCLRMVDPAAVAAGRGAAGCRTRPCGQRGPANWCCAAWLRVGILYSCASCSCMRRRWPAASRSTPTAGRRLQQCPFLQPRPDRAAAPDRPAVSAGAAKPAMALGSFALAAFWWAFLFVTEARASILALGAGCVFALRSPRDRTRALPESDGCSPPSPAASSMCSPSCCCRCSPDCSRTARPSNVVQRTAADPTSRRTLLWQLSLQLIAAHPWLGVGPHHFAHEGAKLSWGASAQLAVADWRRMGPAGLAVPAGRHRHRHAGPGTQRQAHREGDLPASRPDAAMLTPAPPSWWMACSPA